MKQFISSFAIFAVLGLFITFAPVARAFVEVGIVEGYVTNPDSSPAVGASVLITCNSITHFGPTDVNGYYKILFNSGECPDASMVTAQAVKGTLHASDGVIVPGTIDGDVRMDIALISPPIVPEFGMLTGAVASLVSGGLFLLKRRS